MSTEENKAIARRHFEDFWNKADMAAADQIYARDYVHHSHGPDAPAIHSREEFKQWVLEFRTHISEIRFIVEDMIAEGEKVVTRWTATFTPSDTSGGVGTVGERVTLSGIDIARIVDGKIVEDWNAVNAPRA